MKNINIKDERGIILPTVLILILFSSWLVVVMLEMASTDRIVVKDQAEGTAAIYLAEMGMNRITEAMWIGYETAPEATRITWLDNNFTTYDQYGIEVDDPPGEYSTYFLKASAPDNISRYVVFESVGQVGDASRAITRVVQYGLGRSPVFDYAYFANNYGWLWGGGIEVNGEVRSNGDFSVKNAWVNGDIVGSVNDEIGATGLVDGSSNHKDLDWYRNHADDHFRPAYPDADYGYDGESERFPYQEILDMPYLADISRYETLAQDENSSISQGGTTLVNEIYNGTLILIGTAANPIELNGPVVVNGDVIIRGVVSGQGTIYTSRNVHIVGDVEYETQPIWPHDGEDISTYAEHNANADFMGLAARGSIIYGDYTSQNWKSLVRSYIKPPFTSAYIDEDGSWFDADYTAYDGGTKSDGSQRRYYESSLKDSAFSALCATHHPRRIDGLMYTNHLLGGRLENVEINGSIIMRDEAILYSGNIDINYDYRARETGEDYIDIDLPKSPRFMPMVWLDGAYHIVQSSINIDLPPLED